MLRWRPFSESRKKKNDLSVKPEKRRKSQSKKGWRKRHGKSRKRKRHSGEKRNARGIWLTV